MKFEKSKPGAKKVNSPEREIEFGPPLTPRTGWLKIMIGTFAAWIGFLIVLYYNTRRNP